MADAKKEEAEVEAPAPKKKKGKLILFIVIGLVVLALGGGGAAFFFMKKKAGDEADGGEGPAKETTVKKRKSDHATPSFYKFDKPFTVKLQTEQQEAYLQAEVQLRVLDSEAQESLKQYDPELKHRIMLVLLAKKASELSTAQGVQRLSNELRETVNDTLEPPAPKKRKDEAKEPADLAAPDAPVQAVLFTSFIIQ